MKPWPSSWTSAPTESRRTPAALVREARFTGHPFTSSVFIGTSLDGFIAREDGDLHRLTSRGEAAGGDLGYEAFIDGIDAVVMGRGTYKVRRRAR
jgi:hypothetical protein